MMLIFSTAIRYSFKRILKGTKIRDLEKEIAYKFNLNIRQAKDAVECARQTIASQKELVRMNYENYVKKVTAIENILKDEKKNLSKKKQTSLVKKLDKRQRKANYFKKFIDTNTIPLVVFGTKQMFIKRCKSLISNEEWKACRDDVKIFEKKNNWSKWSYINKIIKRKVGEKPDSWIVKRSQILGIA